MNYVTILGVFDTPQAAKGALESLRASSIPLHDTSLIAPDAAHGDQLNVGEGALVGAAWGGLVGLVALVLPGIGPFIAGGAVAAALTGAAAGAVVGGLAGALMQSAGITEEEARRYEQAVQSGKTLVAVKTEDAYAFEVRKLLAHDGAGSIRENETDILAGGPVDVAIYDEQGHAVPMAGRYGDATMIDRPTNTATPVAAVRTPGGAVSDRELALGDAAPPERPLGGEATSGGAASFDDEETAQPSAPGEHYANGARVVSYDDAKKTASR